MTNQNYQPKLPTGVRRNRRRRKKTSSYKSLPFFILFLCFLCVPMAIGKNSTSSKEEQGPIIGIDLGTTYSCVSVFENDGPTIIANDQGNYITPSIVAFTDTNERLVGDAAKNQATNNPENTVYDAKRLIGRDFNDKSVQEDKKLVPFKIVADKLGKPRISIIQNGEEHIYAPEEISALVLKKMKSIAENYLGQEITRAVIVSDTCS